MPRRLEYAEFDNRYIPEPITGCYLWIGPMSGRYGLWGRRKYAHRESHERANGSCGDKFVLHRCDVPLCVNPKHLFLGTQADNQWDAIRKGRRRLNPFRT